MFNYNTLQPSFRKIVSFSIGASGLVFSTFSLAAGQNCEHNLLAWKEEIALTAQRLQDKGLAATPEALDLLRTLSRAPGPTSAELNLSIFSSARMILELATELKSRDGGSVTFELRKRLSDAGLSWEPLGESAARIVIRSPLILAGFLRHFSEGEPAPSLVAQLDRWGAIRCGFDHGGQRFSIHAIGRGKLALYRNFEFTRRDSEEGEPLDRSRIEVLSGTQKQIWAALEGFGFKIQ